MGETALNFGPQWLRALSGGHEGGSPPPQSKKIDYKLADYRYGREEMLALVTNNPKPPAGMDTDETIVHGKAREPLSLESLTEEEANLLQFGVNSEAVRQAARAGTINVSVGGNGEIPNDNPRSLGERGHRGGGGGGPAIGGMLRGRGGSLRGRGGSSSGGMRGGMRGAPSLDDDPESGGKRGAGSGNSWGDSRDWSESRFGGGGPNRNRSFERSQSFGERNWGERNGPANGPGGPAGMEPRRGGSVAGPGGRGSGSGAADNWRHREGAGEEAAPGNDWRHTRGGSEKWGSGGPSWRERGSEEDRRGGYVPTRGPWRGNAGGRGGGSGPGNFRRDRGYGDDDDDYEHDHDEDEHYDERERAREDAGERPRQQHHQERGGEGERERSQPESPPKGREDSHGEPQQGRRGDGDAGAGRGEAPRDAKKDADAERRAKETEARQQASQSQQPTPKPSSEDVRVGANDLGSKSSSASLPGARQGETTEREAPSGHSGDHPGKVQNRPSQNDLQGAGSRSGTSLHHHGMGDMAEQVSHDQSAAVSQQQVPGMMPRQPASAADVKSSTSSTNHFSGTAILSGMKDPGLLEKGSGGGNAGTIGTHPQVVDASILPPQPTQVTWYYQDPTGQIQGPFSTLDMGDWHKRGFFRDHLLLRRNVDLELVTLAGMKAKLGPDPFLPAASQMPPLHLIKDVPPSDPAILSQSFPQQQPQQRVPQVVLPGQQGSSTNILPQMMPGGSANLPGSVPGNVPPASPLRNQTPGMPVPAQNRVSPADFMGPSPHSQRIQSMNSGGHVNPVTRRVEPSSGMNLPQFFANIQMGKEQPGPSWKQGVVGLGLDDRPPQIGQNEPPATSGLEFLQNLQQQQHQHQGQPSMNQQQQQHHHMGQQMMHKTSTPVQQLLTNIMQPQVPTQPQHLQQLPHMPSVRPLEADPSSSSSLSALLQKLNLGGQQQPQPPPQGQHPQYGDMVDQKEMQKMPQQQPQYGMPMMQQQHMGQPRGHMPGQGHVGMPMGMGPQGGSQQSNDAFQNLVMQLGHQQPGVPIQQSQTKSAEEVMAEERRKREIEEAERKLTEQKMQLERERLRLEEERRRNEQRQMEEERKRQEEEARLREERRRAEERLEHDRREMERQKMELQKEMERKEAERKKREEEERMQQALERKRIEDIQRRAQEAEALRIKEEQEREQRAAQEAAMAQARAHAQAQAQAQAQANAQVELEEAERKRDEDMARMEAAADDGRMKGEALKNALLKNAVGGVPWGGKTPQQSATASFLEVQAQEELERAERSLQQQRQQQMVSPPTARAAGGQGHSGSAQNDWNNVPLRWAAPTRAESEPKSLAEIQAEEEQKMKLLQSEKSKRASNASASARGSGTKETAAAAAAAAQAVSWASKAASGLPAAPPPSLAAHFSTPNPSNAKPGPGLGSFWTNVAKANSQPQPVSAASSAASVHQQQPGKQPATRPTPQAAPGPVVPPGAPVGAAGTAASKKASGPSKKDGETVKKLFEAKRPDDDFTKWCYMALQELKIESSIDIATFVAFLKDVESPFDVQDYGASYLGSEKPAREFIREFLERRSKWKNSMKRAKAPEDSMLGPAKAINPNAQNSQSAHVHNHPPGGSNSTSGSQNQNSDQFHQVKAKKGNKKGKKMQKVDNSILGFNVTAASDRVNIGDREFVDGM